MDREEEIDRTDDMDREEEIGQMTWTGKRK